MTKTQAVSKLGETVFYLPTELPAEITWQTPILSGILSEINEKKTRDGEVITRTWGVVNHNTIPLDDLYMTSAAAQSAMKEAYLDMVSVSEAAMETYAGLAFATDTIGIDPNPPPEPEPIEL